MRSSRWRRAATPASDKRPEPIPLIWMMQLGIDVAFGLLPQTMIVRSICLPALTLTLGDRTWFPMLR